MEAHDLVAVPDAVSLELAAASLLQGTTAHVVTHDVHECSPGQVALVHAAAGGTGSLVVQYLRAARAKGVIVAFGQSSGPVPPTEIARLSGLTGEGLPGSLWLTWPTLVDCNATPDDLARRAAAVFDAVAVGDIVPAVAESFPLARAADAHRLIESGTVIGKVLLEV